MVGDFNHASCRVSPGLGYWLPSGGHAAKEGSRKRNDGRLAVASGVSSEENKTEQKTPGCRGTRMKETE